MDNFFTEKSSIEEIRERFDKDVERFSNADTGQQSTMDAALNLELITDAAKAVNPQAKSMLDLGCGAGNYSIKMLSKVPELNCSLVDLSMPMLERAKERVEAQTSGRVEIIQSDLRDVDFPKEAFDIILAGAVLHHLREDEDWEIVFEKLYKALKPGGSIWISDLVCHGFKAVDDMFWSRYADYLIGLGGVEYKDNVLAYIEKEDTPRPVFYQMDLLKKVGFREVEILHKNCNFAAFGGVK